jgi:hypothetical protein
MKTCIAFVFTTISLFSLAQKNDLERAILKGNWDYSFINFDPLDSIPHQIGDTAILSRVPKRLKFKKKRPLRFMKNGTVSSPQSCLGCCGTVSTLESLWALRWRRYSEWKIRIMEGATILMFDDFHLQLIDSRKKQYTFILLKKTKSE